MEKARGRRRRVPAFGKWNYHYSGEPSTLAPTAAEWYAPSLETEACSDVWFKYSPPPRKPPPPSRNAWRTEMEKAYDSGKRRSQAATPARASDVSAPKAARTPAKDASTATARVVRRSVDADLYQVHPPDFEPDQLTRTRKKASRSAWMACLGFSCCVA